MGISIPRHCLVTGCILIASQGGRCEFHAKAHEREREERYHSGDHRGIYQTARWARVRALVLALHPLCVRCEAAGRATIATDVHHVKRLAEHLDLAYAVENLEALCSSCHSKETAKEAFNR